jgi:hypothetical protein
MGKKKKRKLQPWRGGEIQLEREYGVFPEYGQGVVTAPKIYSNVIFTRH